MIFFRKNEGQLQRGKGKGLNKVPGEKRNHVKLLHIPYMLAQYDRYGNIKIPAGLNKPVGECLVRGAGECIVENDSILFLELGP